MITTTKKYFLLLQAIIVQCLYTKYIFDDDVSEKTTKYCPGIWFRPGPYITEPVALYFS